MSEQSTFQHMMPGHTARYCSALADLYAATGDEPAKRKAVSGINALTYMQSPQGLFKTFFQMVNEKRRSETGPTGTRSTCTPSATCWRPCRCCRSFRSWHRRGSDAFAGGVTAAGP